MLSLGRGGEGLNLEIDMNVVLNAELRNDQGKGASRRLRREGRVPAVIYGANKTPANLSLIHKDVIKQLENEAFYSQVVKLNVGDNEESVVLRDLQHHPYKFEILHMDFQRVDENTKISVHVPLHFVGEEVAPGVKQQGGNVSHILTDVEVEGLPKDLPEFIEVDLSTLAVGDILHLSDLKLPAGLELVALKQGAEYDAAVASIHAPKGGAAEAEEASE